MKIFCKHKNLEEVNKNIIHYDNGAVKTLIVKFKCLDCGKVIIKRF